MNFKKSYFIHIYIFEFFFKTSFLIFKILKIIELSANNEIKSLIIDDNAYKVRDEKYFEWRIDAWDEFKDGWYYSPDFYGGNYGWYYILYNKYIYIYIKFLFFFFLLIYTYF